MCTSETFAARSRRNPRVLITSWPSPVSATGSRTHDPLNTELPQRLDDKRSLGDARMRYDQVALIDAVAAEKQDVDVDHTRSPSSGRPAAAIAFHVLGEPQQLTRGAGPFGLDDLIEKPRLVRHAPGLGFDDSASTADSYSSFTQSPPRRAEVAASRPQVGPETQVDPGHHRIRSATRTARTISFTSWTRTMSAPRSTAATTVAVVPSSRSVTGKSSTLPMNDLRDVPTRIGCPSSFSSENRRMTSQFWSAVLPNPTPGSMITFSLGTPAAIARAAATTRNRLISSIRSPGYSVPSWLCITTSPHPCRAARSAMAGERVRPQTSFRIAAPAATPTCATSGLDVSIDTGTPESRASRRRTSSVRETSSATDTGTCPGRVDSPPTSSMSAPSVTMRMPCATAASTSWPRPSPLNESGVTLTIPITYVRRPHSKGRPPISAITTRLSCGL